MDKNNFEGPKQSDLFLSDKEVKEREVVEALRREEAKENRLASEAAKEEGFISAEERRLTGIKNRIPWLKKGVELGVEGMKEKLDAARKALGESGQIEIFNKDNKQ